jgi:CRISPR/Cas system Type II protein with McrA/HNH and RuvC-like nuclease domain
MELSFGYRSPVKKIARYCAYTGKKFTKNLKPTFEHIKPHSKGGQNSIDNCLATTAKSNHLRGNQRFDKWLQENPEVAKNIQAYLDKMRGTKIEGKDYVEAVKKTLNREARGLVSFKGKYLDITA